MKKSYFLLLIFAAFAGKAQIVTTIDPAFKLVLTSQNCVSTSANWENSGDVDTNNDGEIQVSEAEAVLYLDVSNSGLTSLEGIESFTNLKRLYCSGNSLAALDISSLLHLTFLDCSNNALASLNLNEPVYEANEYAYYLNCSHNTLVSLDFKNNKYDTLDCRHNALTSVDLSGITWAYEAYFSYNQLTEIVFPDTSGWDYGFDWLDVSNNLLTTFKVPTGGFLDFNCDNNAQLLSLDMSSAGPFSTSLSITNNASLQSIDFKNGLGDGCLEEDDMTGNCIITYSISNNPALQYICVDSDSEGEFLKTIIGNSSLSYSTYCTFTPGGSYNSIAGTVKLDCGGSNADVDYLPVSITGGSGSGFTYTNNQAYYTVYSGEGSVTIAPQLENPSYFTVTPASFTQNFTTSDNAVAADFCVAANGSHHDVSISILPLTPANPGFDAVYKIVVKNIGTETEMGIVDLSFDDNIADFVTASPAADSQSAGSLSWNFAGLAPFTSSEIIATINLNSSAETPAVNINNLLTFTATATIPSDETFPNNLATLNQTVVGSFDPNDKSVAEGTQISPAQADDYLHYTIRFQNTGDFAAQNVVVKDMLTANLDASTVEITSASHTFHSTITEGNKLEVFFENINLPAEDSDEAASHGYLSFKVRPIAGIAVNDVIENTADIYFDFNSPVATNTTSTVVTELALPQLGNAVFNLYPNPVKNELHVDFEATAVPTSVYVYDLPGKQLLAQKGMQQNTIDVSSLGSGCYFVEAVLASGKSVQKFIKI
jgi:uncharacterized repeat protein (TIGR01451 family)